jgi:sugar/nucleoside kinase (ribokinase family)
VSRLLAVGHVTRDRLHEREVPGGSVTYASLAATALGWEAAVLTSAGPEFDPDCDLPGVSVFRSVAPATTRFANRYERDGTRRQVLSARSDDVDLAVLSDEWRGPDVLFLAPVAGEVPAGAASAFTADVVGAAAQGWLRTVDAEGKVSPAEWPNPAADLAGVHVLFLAEHDLPPGASAERFLEHVPIVALTRGWQGLTLITRQSVQQVPSLPREEVDPTGAGDVFAASFLLRYHETGDPLEAAAFGACAASCVVEGIGTSSLGDRAEIARRLTLRERLIEEGEWDE